MSKYGQLEFSKDEMSYTAPFPKEFSSLPDDVAVLTVPKKLGSIAVSPAVTPSISAMTMEKAISQIMFPEIRDIKMPVAAKTTPVSATASSNKTASSVGSLGRNNFCHGERFSSTARRLNSRQATPRT